MHYLDNYYQILMDFILTLNIRGPKIRMEMFTIHTMKLG
jgi:hypothetical protein